MDKTEEKLTKQFQIGKHVYYLYRGEQVLQDKEVASGYWGRWQWVGGWTGSSWKEIKAKIDERKDSEGKK